MLIVNRKYYEIQGGFYHAEPANDVGYPQNQRFPRHYHLYCKGVEIMNVGANIRRIRLEKDISQEQLAQQVGISQSMLCQIERGTKTVTLPLSVEIAAALRCDLDCLVKDAV